MKNKSNQSGTYIDLFSGCGGFSLGLGCAGWKGIFAIEKDEMAFSTFKHNLLDSPDSHFNWPDWLPQKSHSIQTVLKNHKKNLIELRGKVDLIAGGPPCQGFSLAGRRNSNDPRNQLSNYYLEMVSLVLPKFIVLENVRGFNAAFSQGTGKSSRIPYSEIVKEKLGKLGYKVFSSYVHSQNFGVPQKRTRYLMVGVREDIALKETSPFEILDEIRLPFLAEKGLPSTPVTVRQAIQDLEVIDKRLIYYSGSQDKGFKQIEYKEPTVKNSFLTLMRAGSFGAPTSLRLPRHKPDTINKFKNIQSVCRPGVTLSDAEREAIGTRKQAISVLHPNLPSKTLTTLPDDILHYSEPRILTVRESARIQSFPDRFNFLGAYTTGGQRRTKECPRYTQVGNAVPPLLAEAVGRMMFKFAKEIKS